MRRGARWPAAHSPLGGARAVRWGAVRWGAVRWRGGGVQRRDRVGRVALGGPGSERERRTAARVRPCAIPTKTETSAAWPSSCSRARSQEETAQRRRPSVPTQTTPGHAERLRTRPREDLAESGVGVARPRRARRVAFRSRDRWCGPKGTIGSRPEESRGEETTEITPTEASGESGSGGESPLPPLREYYSGGRPGTDRRNRRKDGRDGEATPARAIPERYGRESRRRDRKDTGRTQFRW